MRVVFLESAQHDLKDLRRYLTVNFGRPVWQSSYTKLKQSIELIRRQPQSGHVPDELVRLNLGPYRQVISGMNRIVYEVREGVVYVHVVCDCRMDLMSLLAQRLLGNR